MIKLTFSPVNAFRPAVRSTTLLLMLLTLLACSGGIFGTGDGDDIVVVDPDTDSTLATGDTAAQSHSPLPIPQFLPAQFVIQFSDGLTTDYPENNRFSTDPVIHTISRAIRKLTAINGMIQVDIDQLEQQLLEPVNQCSNPCRIIESTVTATISQTAIDYQSSLQILPESAVRATAGDQTTFTDVTYNNDLSGYYDQSLAYKRGDGTEVFITWSNDDQLVSATTHSLSDAVYILADFEKSTMTFRIDNKLSATSIQAVAINEIGGNTVLEADWRGIQQHYIRAQASATGTTLYSLHPTDPSVPRLREFISLPQLSYTIDSCVTDADTCNSWSSLINDNPDLPDPFANTLRSVGDFTDTITSPLQPALPAQVHEYVISAETDGGQPSAMSLLCGGQRVINSLRTFCWQPLPLETESTVFEESFTGGATIYRRLPDASF